MSIKDNLDLLTKYRPKTVNDIVCNKDSVDIIHNWLKGWEEDKDKINKYKEEFSIVSFNKTKKLQNFGDSSLLVTGHHGIGKTSTIEVIAKDLEYNIQTIDIAGLKLGKEVDGAVEKILKSSNILDMIHNNDTSKTLIVIDDLEAVSSTINKSFITGLQKLNEVERINPIIFISDNHHNKLLIDIKKKAKEIKFRQPNELELITILERITKAENIVLDKKKEVTLDESVTDKIVDQSQNDIRRLVSIIQDLKDILNENSKTGKKNKKSNLVTDKIIDDYIEISKKKDMDADLFKATNDILNKYNGIGGSLKYYDTDKVLLPLMVHQNYVKNVIANHVNTNRFNVINSVAASLSEGDVIENFIYGDQSWDMQDVHGFYTCAATSFYINNKKTNSKIPNIVFSSDLNKTSIKRINKKNINNTDRCFDNMDITDYMYMSKIISSMINSNDIDKCVSLLDEYDMKVEYLDSLLKIDKINEDPAVISSKQKKELLKYFKE